MKLKNIVESFSRYDDKPEMSKEEKQEVLKMISEYNELGKQLDRAGSLPDIAGKLSKIADVAQKMTLSETDDWFDSQTVKKNMNDLKKASSEFMKLAKETNQYEQRMTALFEDMGHLLSRYFQIQEPIEEVNDIKDLYKS